MATTETRRARRSSARARGVAPCAPLALFRVAGLAWLTFCCGLTDGASRLSKSDEDLESLPSPPPPPEDAAKLGAIAHHTPVLERPSTKAKAIGTLHAGALVARSEEPVRRSQDCPAGYFAIFPRGYVCLSQGATLDLSHPTLAAMAIRPAFDRPLPYAYARTTTETELLERDPNREAGVRVTQKLSKGAGFAVVGSWSAGIGDQEPVRLGLLTNGRFVRAEHLRAAEASEFEGYEVGPDSPLPVGFVVKRGIRLFKENSAGRLEKDTLLEYHTTVRLFSRYRTFDKVRYWMTTDKQRWVRDRDVTIIHRRTQFPEFAKDDQRWIDVGIVQGTLVAYEGKKPIFATLVSTGRDRLGASLTELANTEMDTLDASSAEPREDQDITKLGVFEVVSKSVSLLEVPPERAGERYPLYDLPWALELSSGQFLFGAYWHNRFGVEHGSGDVMLSPADAGRLFAWATPELPKAWHGAVENAQKTRTIVYVHK